MIFGTMACALKFNQQETILKNYKIKNHENNFYTLYFSFNEHSRFCF